MNANLNNSDLFGSLRKKALLKQDIYRKTLSTFRMFKSIMQEMIAEYQEKYNGQGDLVPFEFRDRGEFEIELKFGGDVLIFMMHTNIFEFSRLHGVAPVNSALCLTPN